MEMIYAIIDYKDISKEKLEEIRKNKQEEGGGLAEKLFLIGVEE